MNGSASTQVSSFENIKVRSHYSDVDAHATEMHLSFKIMMTSVFNFMSRFTHNKYTKQSSRENTTFLCHIVFFSVILTVLLVTLIRETINS